MVEEMQQLSFDLFSLAALAMTAVGLLGAYAGFLLTRTSRAIGRAHRRIDHVNSRVDQTRETYVSHKMLNGQLRRIDDKLEGLHRHFAERAGALKEQHARLQHSVDQVHERIDDLLRDSAHPHA